MKQGTVCVLTAALWAVACGGSSFTSGDGGTPNDGGSSGSSSGGSSSSSSSGSSSGSGGSSGSGSSSGVVGGDASSDGPGTVCNGNLKSCGGVCVDTGSDPMNCGGCGVVCNTQCVSGVCALIAADAGAPPAVGDNACLAVDATNVYWATGLQGGSVWKVPVAGGAPTQLVGNQAAPHAVASDGTMLFFGDQGVSGTGTCTGSIEAIPVGGGGTAAIVASAQCTPMDMQVDAKNVYWSNSGDGSVWQCDKSIPNPVKLAGGNGAAQVYLRVNATDVYFTSSANGTGTVNRVPIGGGTVTQLVASVPGPAHLALDLAHVYFGSRSSTSSALLAIPFSASSGTPTQLVPNLPSINGIEADGVHVWFAEGSDVQPYVANTGEIHRVTAAGTTDAILAKNQNGPNCIAVDQTSVYWIDTGGGMISKTAK